MIVAALDAPWHFAQRREHLQLRVSKLEFGWHSLRSAAGHQNDTYLYAHTQFDAQGAFRMYRGLQFIVSGLNLTNEVFGFYNGSQIFPIQREYYKPTYSFGLSYTFSNEPKVETFAALVTSVAG